LLGAQFDFSRYTHNRKEKDGLYYFIYDYGICQVETNTFKIIHYGK
jgi:hypothetical protein